MPCIRLGKSRSLLNACVGRLSEEPSVTTYYMTVESLVGKGPSKPDHDDTEEARDIAARMSRLLATDNIEIRVGRENSSIDFDHRCSIENALARAHSHA